uniref:Cyclin-dependent kinases regulatory subunit n=1 Tax=Plectus sambesii TaxID=2011161 RepID=A0A914WZK2_9BILA
MIPVSQLIYSDKYTDDKYEFRHVIIPKEFVKHISKTHLMTETEWRNLGIAQSPGWVHYMIHQPEPHVLMFRRLRTDLVENKENNEKASSAV